MNTYSKDLLKIKNHLKEHKEGLTVSQIAKFLEVNRNSVAKYLDVLLISGQVEMRQIGPAKLFVLSNNIPSGDLLDYSNEGMLFLDSDLKIIQHNKTLKKFFELEQESLCGMKVFELPDDFFTSDKFLTDCQKVQEIGSATNQSSYQNQRTQRFFKYRFFKTIFENGASGYGFIISDITLTKEKEQSFEFQVKFEELIATIATDFIGTTKEEVSIEIFRALKKIGHISEVDRSMIYLFSDSKQEAQNTYIWTKNPDDRNNHRTKLQIASNDSWIHKLLKFEPVYIYEGKGIQKAEKKILQDLHITSAMFVPLILEGNLIGTLGVVMNDDNRYWSQQITSMLTMCSKVFIEVFKKYEVIGKIENEI